MKMWQSIGLMLVTVLGFLAVGIAHGCAEAKPIARTVNDAAKIACETAFGAEPLPQGMTIKDFCEAQEDLQPFVEQILAAKSTVGAAHGLKPKE